MHHQHSTIAPLVTRQSLNVRVRHRARYALLSSFEQRAEEAHVHHIDLYRPLRDSLAALCDLCVAEEEPDEGVVVLLHTPARQNDISPCDGGITMLSLEKVCSMAYVVVDVIN